MSESLLITAANGRTGRALVSALRGSGHPVRAFIRDIAQWPRLQQLGADDYAVGDLLDDSSIRSALTACHTVVLIGPPMHPEEVATAARFIDAARAVGVRKIVYYSVMHPLRRSVRHHRLKLDAEQLVVESGLPYVIVQPARYMQHLEAIWPTVMATGVHAMPFSTSVLFNLVDLQDLAAATRRVALSSEFDYGTFELAGPEALSQQDMATIISEVTGHAVAARMLDHDAMLAKARAGGASEDRLAQMRIMNEHYDQHGFRGNPQVLQWILGRPAMSFRAYVQRLHDSLLAK
jgi:uncharacterized protein YbjT (DUF2867 family)